MCVLTYFWSNSVLCVRQPDFAYFVTESPTAAPHCTKWMAGLWIKEIVFCWSYLAGRQWLSVKAPYCTSNAPWLLTVDTKEDNVDKFINVFFSVFDCNGLDWEFCLGEFLNHLVSISSILIRVIYWRRWYALCAVFENWSISILFARLYKLQHCPCVHYN